MAVIDIRSLTDNSDPIMDTLCEASPAILTEELLRENIDVRLRVTGSSMQPFIRSNDVLTIIPLSDRQLSSMDIIAYRSKHSLIIHRFVRETDTHLITTGDHYTHEVAHIQKDQLLGKVTHRQRGTRITRLTSPYQKGLAKLWLSARPLRRRAQHALTKQIA